jgi:hypothetical protein
MDTAVINMVEHDLVDLGGTDEWESCIGEKEEFVVESMQMCKTGVGFTDDVCMVSRVTSTNLPSTDVVLKVEEGVLGTEAGVPRGERGVPGK